MHQTGWKAKERVKNTTKPAQNPPNRSKTWIELAELHNKLVEKSQHQLKYQQTSWKHNKAAVTSMSLPKKNWTNLKPTESSEIWTKPDESMFEPTEISPNQYKTQQNWQNNCMNRLKLVKTYC